MTRTITVRLTPAQAAWLADQMQQVADLAGDRTTERRAEAVMRAIGAAKPSKED